MHLYDDKENTLTKHEKRVRGKTRKSGHDRVSFGQTARFRNERWGYFAHRRIPQGSRSGRRRGGSFRGPEERHASADQGGWGPRRPQKPSLNPPPHPTTSRFSKLVRQAVSQVDPSISIHSFSFSFTADDAALSLFLSLLPKHASATTPTSPLSHSRLACPDPSVPLRLSRSSLDFPSRPHSGMAVPDVEAVLEFLRKNGFSEAESALREDIVEKADLGSLDFEKFLFPMAPPPPPPLRVPACSRRPGPPRGGRGGGGGGGCSAGSSGASSDDRFVSVGSSTSDVCSSGSSLPTT